MIGQTLGHYRVLEQIGAGGMGEVYRARDEHLHRDVALKLLPETFAQDAERLARLSREAQLLASVNHPNIAAIYRLEESDTVRCLVLELVEGETLSARILRGRLPLDEALPLARQIAEGLEAAHDRGIIHRDLKPANVKVTAEGQVKILDFGLAKAISSDSQAVDLARSPTVSEVLGRTGVILGTAAYMSPEQARGRPLDKRTDIWSFGCVLYEMLAGRLAFGGDTVSDVIAAILQRDPDWEALPPGTPPTIHRLLRRCLDRDHKRRLRDIGEARFALEDTLAGSGETARAGSPAAPRAWMQPSLARLLGGAFALILFGLGLGWWWGARQPRARWSDLKLQQLTYSAADDPLYSAAISADGKHLAYATFDGVFLRRLETGETHRLRLLEGFCFG